MIFKYLQAVAEKNFVEAIEKKKKTIIIMHDNCLKIF